MMRAADDASDTEIETPRNFARIGNLRRKRGPAHSHLSASSGQLPEESLLPFLTGITPFCEKLGKLSGTLPWSQHDSIQFDSRAESSCRLPSGRVQYTARSRILVCYAQGVLSPSQGGVSCRLVIPLLGVKRFIMARRVIMFAVCVGFSVGCSMEPPKPAAPAKERDRGSSARRLKDIGEFDPKAGREVSDSKIRTDDPFPLPRLQAYGPMIEKISKDHIDYALKLYQAEHDRFPKDYAEFMEEIIKKNNIQLPVLPAQAQYQYDVENHKLVIVRAEAGKPAP